MCVGWASGKRGSTIAGSELQLTVSWLLSSRPCRMAGVKIKSTFNRAALGANRLKVLCLSTGGAGGAWLLCVSIREQIFAWIGKYKHVMF